MATTRAWFQQYTPQIEPAPVYNKWDCVTIAGKIHIIMAKLSADKNSPITYNICTDELLAPQFGVSLDTAELIPSLALSEKIRNRAKNFL